MNDLEKTQTEEKGDGGKWIILQRYSLAADLLSQGKLNSAHINKLLRTLSVVHGLLAEEQDAIYEDQCKDLVKFDNEVMQLREEDYLPNRYDFAHRWFGGISGLLMRKEWNIETKALRRFYKVAGIASDGRMSMGHVNYLLRSIQTVHDMLGELFDVPYISKVAELASDDRKIMAMKSDESYLDARYNYCQKWIAAIAGLLNRKGLVAPPKVIMQNEEIGPEDRLDG